MHGSRELAGLGRFEEPAVLVLASLFEGPLHGFAIVEAVEAACGVRLGPGTLYATLGRLEVRGLIEALSSDDRRRPYRLTGAGQALVEERLERMQAIDTVGPQRLVRV